MNLNSEVYFILHLNNYRDPIKTKQKNTAEVPQRLIVIV